MAQQFGGKYSPNPSETGVKAKQPDWSNMRPKPSNFRARAITSLGIPIIVAGALDLSRGEPIAAAVNWGAAAALATASWLIAEGQKAELAFESRQIAKPPTIPRKLFGAILIGTAAFGVFTMNPDWGILNGALMGVLGFGAALAAFGLDPMRAKGLEGDNAFERERVAIAIEKAEAYVTETLDAIKRIGDRKLTGRVEKLAAAARDMFRTIEDDPRDLSSSRKYLSVYLKGARDATRKFADLYTRSGDQKARTDYEALLDDLEISFSKRRETLLLENRTDLDVEIEVLRDRLAASVTRN